MTAFNTGIRAMAKLPQILKEFAAVMRATDDGAACQHDIDKRGSDL